MRVCCMLTASPNKLTYLICVFGLQTILSGKLVGLEAQHIDILCQSVLGGGVKVTICDFQCHLCYISYYDTFNRYSYYDRINRNS